MGGILTGAAVALTVDPLRKRLDALGTRVRDRLRPGEPADAAREEAPLAERDVEGGLAVG